MLICRIAICNQRVVVCCEDSEEKRSSSPAVGHCPTCRAEMHLADLHPQQAALFARVRLEVSFGSSPGSLINCLDCFKTDLAGSHLSKLKLSGFA